MLNVNIYPSKQIDLLNLTIKLRISNLFRTENIFCLAFNIPTFHLDTLLDDGLA